MVFLNDRFVPKTEAVVSVFDHGFLYGDGIYETLRAYDGVVFRLDEHIERLFRSASFIGIDIPKGIDEIKSLIYESLIANRLRNAYIRITISRGTGPIGLDPDLCLQPTFVIITEPFKQYPGSYYKNGVRAIVSSVRRNAKESLNPKIKSLNFLNNILAKIEAKKNEAYEAIMLSVEGYLAEGTITNIFFIKDNTLFTPSTDVGILDGITRAIIIGLAIRSGMRVMEGRFSLEDLYSADEVFISNTTMELMPVREVDNKSFKVGIKTKGLHKLYAEEVKAYIRITKEQGPSIWDYD